MGNSKFKSLSLSLLGIGQKANDSLANIFDNTWHEEYESCPQDEMSALEEYVEKQEECKKDTEGMQQDEQVEEAEFKDGKYLYINSLNFSCNNHYYLQGNIASKN